MSKLYLEKETERSRLSRIPPAVLHTRIKRLSENNIIEEKKNKNYLKRVRLCDTGVWGTTRFSPSVVLSITVCSERPKEATWWAVVHRHVEIKVGVGNIVVKRGQVGQLGHIGSSNWLQEEPLGAGQQHLREVQRGAHRLWSSVGG